MLFRSADRFSLSPYNTFHSLADFSDELDAALKNGDIDFTIQFLHECPEEADPLIDTVALTPREDARDLLVMPRSRTIADLRPGDRVGYYSERQRYQFDRLVPDLQYNAFTRYSICDESKLLNLFSSLRLRHLFQMYTIRCRL